MKKIIFKSSLFILPFFISYFASNILGSSNKGDLLRIGNLIDNTENYRDVFNSTIYNKTLYTSFSELRKNDTTKFDILTIGDSGSQQHVGGYQNYLEKNGFKVLHYNKSVNSLQILHNLITSKFLDSLNLKYILIESSERYFFNRLKHTFTKKSIYFVNDKNSPTNSQNNHPSFFSSSIVGFPMFNLLHELDDNAYFSQVYKVKTSKPLFSCGNQDLLFLQEDLTFLEINNNINNLKHLNTVLNTLTERLKSRNIKLIVLPFPNKYSLYYDYIIDKKSYPKPMFFDYFSSLEKKYIYIDTNGILKRNILKKKDIYFYDDSHWSPIASEIIANEITKTLRH